MESTTPSWFYDLEMEDDYNNFFLKEYNMNNLLLDDPDEDYFLTNDIGNSIMFESLSNNNKSSIDEATFDDDERPSKLLKTSTNNNSSNNSSSSLSPKFSSISSASSITSSSFQSHILCFDNSNSSPNSNATQLYDLDYNTMNTNTKKNGVVNNGSSNKHNLVTKPSSHGFKRSPSHAQDHIIAERKRREKISQSFIALAALVPGLKKMDKATVLDNAINYVKDLKARLATLEQENKKKKKTKEVEEEPCVVVLSKRTSQHDDESGENNDESVVVDDDGSDENDSSSLHLRHVHVEARVSGQQVLLRIHCHNHKGILVKLLSEIQGLNLLVLNSSVLPFGDSLLDITVIA
ncbi:hypothetical protein PIB30_027872 [Stylosanthes scabra]|uniref:BHLH domain-containing protein n=1 Tax=Stylosanthes scabra TaxID=79078 RepID=A0ABU6WCX4_9FABA|nr:hypothetical protein [Stylosanthes scabra]